MKLIALCLQSHEGSAVPYSPFFPFIVSDGHLRVPEHLQSLTVAWCDGTVSQFTGDYIFTLPTFKLLAWHTEALGSLQSQLIPLPPKLGILNYHERLKT